MGIDLERLKMAALVRPELRQQLMDTGTITLYSDYAGFASSRAYGAACCAVYNRSISVHACKLPLERDLGSNYGEMKAVGLCLDTLKSILTAYTAKAAVIYSDCSRITRILAQDRFAYSHDEQARDELLALLADIGLLFPQVVIDVRYIGRRKRHNSFHRIAHHAARQAAHDAVPLLHSSASSLIR